MPRNAFKIGDTLKGKNFFQKEQILYFKAGLKEQNI